MTETGVVCVCVARGRSKPHRASAATADAVWQRKLSLYSAVDEQTLRIRSCLAGTDHLLFRLSVFRVPSTVTSSFRRRGSAETVKSASCLMVEPVRGTDIDYIYIKKKQCCGHETPRIRHDV